jgi:hypothetical protein
LIILIIMFLSKHFNSPLITWHYYLLMKTKLIPLIYHKSCIRYSIFKHNV